MNPSTAAKEINSGQFRPVYVLFGKDRYRMQEFVTYLTDKLLDKEERELGVVKFDTAETLVDEIVLEAETMPFFVARKLVLVRDQTVFAAGGKEGKLQHDIDRLLEYLKHPTESSVIVFLVHSDKLDERRKIVKLLKERDNVIAFQELDGAELIRWITRRASSQGRTISEAAAERLILRVGTGLQALAQETDKLCLHAGTGGTVREEDIELLTAPSLEEDVFALIDAMSGSRVDRALQLYRQLLVRKEEPIKITALVVRQFRMMLQIKELEGRSYSHQQMASIIGQHPYAVKLAAEKARTWKAERLGRHLAALADLDYRMKTGQVDKELGLELFLLSLGA
ncbi:DNA polymerase III subunit delta [Paenibacillus tarimensis]|nr:DNA polymerase III subunit delta [Paenibacillus tarimensis]